MFFQKKNVIRCYSELKKEGLIIKLKTFKKLIKFKTFKKLTISIHNNQFVKK
jgi:hypothetical protein